MLLKNREIPRRLHGYEAAFLRLNPNSDYFNSIEAKIYNSKAGLAGERMLDRALEGFKYDFPYYMFQDLTLFAEKAFQIDTLFVTPSHIVPIEVKYLSGELEVKDHQLIKLDMNGKTVMDSPFDQLKNIYDQLTIWLKERSIDIPIYPKLVFPYPKIIEHDETEIELMTVKSAAPTLRRIPYKPILDENKFHYLGSELLNSKVDFSPYPIFRNERIPLTELVTGVVCKRCNRLGMVKVNKGWKCNHCEAFSQRVQDDAIKEYAMLIGNRLTKHDFSYFLGMNNPQAAKRMLDSLGLNKIGEKKHVQYLIDIPF